MRHQLIEILEYLSDDELEYLYNFVTAMFFNDRPISSCYESNHE